MSLSRLLDLRVQESRVVRRVKPPCCGEACRLSPVQTQAIGALSYPSIRTPFTRLQYANLVSCVTYQEFIFFQNPSTGAHSGALYRCTFWCIVQVHTEQVPELPAVIHHLRCEVHQFGFRILFSENSMEFFNVYLILRKD